jgi:hypothetical protein
MSESNLDKAQKFSGISRSANPVKPRTLVPGGTEDREEAVDLKPIDQSRPRGLNEPPEPGSVSGHDPSRATGTGDAPYRRPADDTKDLTTPILDPVREWGRTAPEMNINRWEAQAANPGRTGPLDPTNLNPPRPNWGAPANAAYDVNGTGEGEENIGGQPGKLPEKGKRDQWA